MKRFDPRRETLELAHRAHELHAGEHENDHQSGEGRPPDDRGGVQRYAALAPESLFAGAGAAAAGAGVVVELDDSEAAGLRESVM